MPGGVLRRTIWSRQKSKKSVRKHSFVSGRRTMRLRVSLRSESLEVDSAMFVERRKQLAKFAVGGFCQHPSSIASHVRIAIVQQCHKCHKIATPLQPSIGFKSHFDADAWLREPHPYVVNIRHFYYF